MIAVPEVEEHFEGVEVQGEGAAGDEARAFGVEPIADPVSGPAWAASARGDCLSIS